MPNRARYHNHGNAYNTIKVRMAVIRTGPEMLFGIAWRGMYIGLKSRHGQRLVTFSVWDKPGDAVVKIDEIRDRVQLQGNLKNCQCGRFFGEGTGASISAPIDWELGRIYEFEIRATNSKSEFYSFVNGVLIAVADRVPSDDLSQVVTFVEELGDPPANLPGMMIVSAELDGVVQDYVQPMTLLAA